MKLNTIKSTRSKCNKFNKLRLHFFILIIFVLGANSLPAVEWHGSFETIYNPRKELIYSPHESNLEDTVIIPSLVYYVDQQTDPVTRHTATTFAKNFIRELETDYRLVHNFYQSFHVNGLNFMNENGTLIFQGRVYGGDREGQPDFSIRQLYYKHRKLYPWLDDIRIGRILSTRAAGITNYDGASLNFAHNKFYLNLYGGALLDNDYLHKSSEKCNTRPDAVTCSLGGDFSNEDYTSKWEASDIRNATSKERQGDSIAGIAVGYNHSKYNVELDYQSKTDAKSVVEKIGGINLTADPKKDVSVYIRSRANLLKGEQISSLAGVTYRYKNWRIMPEYEFYKPSFKKDSFWDSFNPYARAATRLKLYRHLGRKMVFHLSGGNIHYIADDSKSESLTTETTVDPVTGEVIGSRDKRPPEMPQNPSDLFASPANYNPDATQNREPSRPMTPEEALVAEMFKPELKDGTEGSIGLTFMTDWNIQWRLLGSSIQGPEGTINKASLHFSYPYRKFRVTFGGGRAFYKDDDSKTDDRQINFGDFTCRYMYSTTVNFLIGIEFYADHVYANDVRGRMGFKYAF